MRCQAHKDCGNEARRVRVTGASRTYKQEEPLEGFQCQLADLQDKAKGFDVEIINQPKGEQ